MHGKLALRPWTPEPVEIWEKTGNIWILSKKSGMAGDGQNPVFCEISLALWDGKLTERCQIGVVSGVWRSERGPPSKPMKIW